MGHLRNHQRADHRTFKMHERAVSVGDDYWIEDQDGHRAFKVDGKALRLRDTWRLEDAGGREVATIKEKKLSIRDRITIDMGGREATVAKALVGLRDRFHVEIEGGDELSVHGRIADHDYVIERDGERVAEISKKWFRVRDTYGVEVYDAADTVLVLATTVAVDALSHD